MVGCSGQLGELVCPRETGINLTLRRTAGNRISEVDAPDEGVGTANPRKEDIFVYRIVFVRLLRGPSVPLDLDSSLRRSDPFGTAAILRQSRTRAYLPPKRQKTHLVVHTATW